MKNQRFSASLPYRYPDGTSKRLVAMRAKRLIRAAWQAVAAYGANPASDFELRSVSSELHLLYPSLLSSPDRRRILTDARRVVNAINDALRRHERNDFVGPLLEVVLSFDLPDSGPQVADPVHHEAYRRAPDHIPTGHLIDAPKTEYGWARLNLALEGAQYLKAFLAQRAAAQATYARTRAGHKAAERYQESAKGKSARRSAIERYAQSEKGKAARKAASARYRAKLKQQVNPLGSNEQTSYTCLTTTE